MVHFTTAKGRLGILDSGVVKSRPRLQADERLEFILKLNTPVVRDAGWEDYVNLSVTRINSRLFDIASGRWHPGIPWCILGFNPTVISHDGVWFVTTNNMYPAARRAQGQGGLEALFANPVRGIYATPQWRTPNMPMNQPTDFQAEVLYPAELSTEFMTRIVVRSDEDQDEALGQMNAVGHRPVPVEVVPELFGAL